MKSCISLAVAVALIFSASRASADFQFTGSGTSSDGPIAAEAYFTLQNGQITMYLANLTSGLQGQGQSLSGIQFTVSAPPNSSLSLSTVAGNVVDLANGTFTPESPLYQSFTATGTPPTAANWSAQTNNNVTDIGNPSNPHYMIVGPNASFSNGGDNFNPYFQSNAPSPMDLATAPQGYSVVFVLNAPGATTGSTIGNVVFNFGTSPNEHTLNGNGGRTPPPPQQGPSPVPAPSSIALAGLGGLCVVGFVAMSRRRTAAVVA